MLSIDESKDVLKSLDDMRFYHDYIDTRLAGDFASDIVKHIKGLDARVADLTRENQKLRWIIVDEGTYEDDSVIDKVLDSMTDEQY